MKLSEFQNIMPVENIPSVLNNGILSNYLSHRLSHKSVALEDVQEKRDKVRIPGGLSLHRYANVYFHARNPMMSCRRSEAPQLCILRVSVDILKINGAVITDQNAASRYVRFWPPSGIEALNLDYIFADNWKHPENEIEEWRHSSAKCAEVLIPDKIAPDYLIGAYAVDSAVKLRMQNLNFNLPITINPDLFFH